MKKFTKHTRRFAALLAAVLILALAPLSAAAADEEDLTGQETPAEGEVPAQDLAELAGAATPREMLDRRLAQRLEDGPVEEKTPPAGSPSATDILASTQVIAHGLGEVGGVTTLNCLEGFLEGYAKGVRVFEADLRLTADGRVVLRHDWWNTSWQSGIDWARIPTRDKFLSEKILDKYTPLSFRDLLQLMEVYPDICVITDTKFTESDVFTIQFDSMLADARELGLTYLFDRIAIQVYSGNMRTGLHNIYPFPHYIYTLYQDEDFTGTKDSFRERAAYCAKHGIKGIAIDQHWWNPAFASIADEYGIQLYVHTVNDAATAKKLLDAGCDAVYTDSLTPAQLS